MWRWIFSLLTNIPDGRHWACHSNIDASFTEMLAAYKAAEDLGMPIKLGRPIGGHWGLRGVYLRHDAPDKAEYALHDRMQEILRGHWDYRRGTST